MDRREYNDVYDVMLNWFAELDLDGEYQAYEKYWRPFRCLCLAQKYGDAFYKSWEETEYKTSMLGLCDYWNFFFFIALMA